MYSFHRDGDGLHPLTVIRVNGSYKNKIIRKFFVYQFLRKIPVAISYNSHLRFAIMMINLCAALMFNYMVTEMPTLDQNSQEYTRWGSNQ